MAANGRRPTKAEQGERIERTLEVMAQNPGAREFKLCSLLAKELDVDRRTAGRYVTRARAYAAEAQKQRLTDLSHAIVDWQLDLIARCRRQNNLREECRAMEGLRRLVHAPGAWLDSTFAEPECNEVRFTIVDPSGRVSPLDGAPRGDDSGGKKPWDAPDYAPPADE